MNSIAFIWSKGSWTVNDSVGRVGILEVFTLLYLTLTMHWPWFGRNSSLLVSIFFLLITWLLFLCNFYALYYTRKHLKVVVVTWLLQTITHIFNFSCFLTHSFASSLFSHVYMDQVYKVKKKKHRNMVQMIEKHIYWKPTKFFK